MTQKIVTLFERESTAEIHTMTTVKTREPLVLGAISPYPNVHGHPDKVEVVQSMYVTCNDSQDTRSLSVTISSYNRDLNYTVLCRGVWVTHLCGVSAWFLGVLMCQSVALDGLSEMFGGSLSCPSCPCREPVMHPDESLSLMSEVGIPNGVLLQWTSSKHGNLQLTSTCVWITKRKT